MSNEKYHIFKLNNGEDVICKLIKTTDEHYEISDPMKMDLFSKHGPRGFMETLGLSRWLQPFTDETVHKIPTNKPAKGFDTDSKSASVYSAPKVLIPFSRSLIDTRKKYKKNIAKLKFLKDFKFIFRTNYI